MTASTPAPSTPGRAHGASMTKPFANSPRMNVLSQKKTGPMWSMTGRTEIKTLSLGPGPGAYSPHTAGLPKAPSYSMLARKEDKPTSGANPGPGAYSPDGKLRKQIPVSLKSRHSTPSANAGQPGPGAYTPSNPNHVSSQWTMLGRRSDKGSSSTPGPLDYRPEKPQTARVSSIHTKIKYKDSESLRNPGPGAYNETDASRYRAKAPIYSIQGRTGYAPMSAKTPGPGAYETPEARTNIAYSMTPRRGMHKSPSNPGPGAYSPTEKKGRAAGMGVGNRFDGRDQNGKNPGPGAYTPTVDFYSRKESAPRYSMTARRAELKSGGANPGPGAYTPAMESVKICSPRYSLGGRLDGTGKGVPSPGPAHYNPQRPVTAPGITLKSRIDVKPAFVTPSPAAYKVSCSACASPAVAGRAHMRSLRSC